MKLLNEIIDLSTNAETSLSVILRKLLVLSYELDNGRLTAWANAELDGYDNYEDLPDYRVITTGARGTFSGAFGAGIKNAPLPAVILDEAHRSWAIEARVGQNIAEIEATAARNGGRRPWPANLVLLYQHSFYQGYALVEAWQDMPGPVFVGIADTVRNRALRFALELRRELGSAGDDLGAIPSAEVDQNVTNFIYGGNYVIGGTSHRFSQASTQTITAGDQVGLAASLGALGFSGVEIGDLIKAIKADSADKDKPGIGKRAAAWLGTIGTAIGTAGLSVATDTAKLEAGKLVAEYLGLA